MLSGLESLPEELVCNVAARLNFADILSLRLTSRTMANKSEYALATHDWITHRDLVFNCEELERLQEISQYPLFAQNITRLCFNAHPIDYTLEIEYEEDEDLKADLVDKDKMLEMRKKQDEAPYKPTGMHAALLASILSNLRNLASILIEDKEHMEYVPKDQKQRLPWSSWRVRALLTALKTSNIELDTLELSDSLINCGDLQTPSERSPAYLEGLKTIRSLFLDYHHEPEHDSHHEAIWNRFSDILSAAKNINELRLCYESFWETENEDLAEHLNKNLGTLQHLSRLSSLSLGSDIFCVRMEERTLCSILHKLETSLINLELTECVLITGSWLNVFKLMKNQMSLQSLKFRYNYYLPRNHNERLYEPVCFNWPGVTWAPEDFVMFSDDTDRHYRCKLEGESSWIDVKWSNPVSSDGSDIEELVKEKGMDKVLDDMIAGFVE